MGNSIASIQYIANILKNKKLCLDTSPMTNGYNKGERTWNVARLKFTIKDNIPRNTIPLVQFLDVLLDVSYKEYPSVTVQFQGNCGGEESKWIV